MTSPGLKYALVTPVRDEAANLVRLAESIERQTVAPVAWVIVDTASTDGTPEVAAQLATRLPMLRIMAIDGPAEPTRGGPVVRAFHAALPTLDPAPDVVVKLDADLSFDPDYFSEMLNAFAANPRLGVASGICTELRDGNWEPLYGTRSHVWGQARAYRWACLQQVLPLEERRGWDEIDAIKARIRGWEVGTFAQIRFRHHRPEGTRDGAPRWRRMGAEAHYMGYRFSYLMVRAGFRARRDPSALAMIPGYLEAALRRAPQCPDAAVRAHLRRAQAVRRLPVRFREARGRVV